MLFHRNVTLCETVTVTVHNGKCLLDRVAVRVLIHGADRPDDGAQSRILFHLHHVAGPLESRRLVLVLHVYPHRRQVLSVHADEARVRVCVAHLHLQRVRLLFLVIERLRRETKRPRCVLGSIRTITRRPAELR